MSDMRSVHMLSDALVVMRYERWLIDEVITVIEDVEKTVSRLREAPPQPIQRSEEA